MFVRTRSVLIAFVASLACAGCGGGPVVWVEGKVTKSGAAYMPPEGHRLEVTLRAVEVTNADGTAVSADEPFQAQVDHKAGTFVVPGRDGRGIQPGKYRVAIVEKLTREALRKEEEGGSNVKRPTRKAPDINRDTDFFKGRFGSNASPIVIEIKNSGEMVIDLDRPGESPRP